MASRKLEGASTTDVATSPVPADAVVSGSPESGFAELHAGDDWSVGVWTHSAGVSTDVEVDEVFVVLEGRGRIDIDGGEGFDFAPGDVVLLEAGDRTTWTVHEHLRKLYVTLPPRV